ncbi:DUF2652 domain-containing protein [Chryseobacterium cheonjiense]|uniref:DUF2652 domain-containing protein n=1 Tax=Chryseobacterium cheonjiense TaxID=2728845 RepID=A0A7Y0A414_9FLAO|nr:DUF2652 domain-containing protein [Chryseobacterium cheonjiense]NML56251.1 DUF2652 domain-containing protein [Chryseobacterium cheonjiense]
MNCLYKKYLSENKNIRVEKGLIIIPDISGYTEFVNGICIEAGRYITRELLSTILQADTIGMSVSEIEGDAILFYKFGKKPPVHKILKMYETMLNAFNIKRKEIESVVGYTLNLSLKLVAHYGSFSEYTIGPFKKLYGEPVVKAHSLLKNNIESKTYILLTSALVGNQMSEKEYSFINYQSENIFTTTIKNEKNGTNNKGKIRPVSLQSGIV